MVKDLYISKTLKDLNSRCTYNYDKNKSIKAQLEFANRAFMAAQTAFKADDEEKAYFLYMKFLDCVTKLMKTTEFKRDEKKYKMMYQSTQLNEAMNKAEDLAHSLERRYTQLDKLNKIKEDKKAKVEKAAIEKDKLKKEKDKNEEETNSYITKGSINMLNFFKLCFRSDESLLVMDIRNESEFESSHINFESCINVPKDIIKPGSVCSKIEAKLSAKSKTLWNRREQFKYVIILDWFSDVKRLNSLSDPLRSLKDSIWKWEQVKKLKHEPVILEEGYAEFLEVYPQFTTNSKVQVPTNKPKTDNINSLINFSYDQLQIPDKKAPKVVQNQVSTPTKVFVSETKPSVTSQSNLSTKKTNLNQNDSTKTSKKSAENLTINRVSIGNKTKPVFDRSVKPKLETSSKSDHQEARRSLKDEEIDLMESARLKAMESTKNLDLEIKELERKKKLIELQKAKKEEEETLQRKKSAEKELAETMRNLKVEASEQGDKTTSSDTSQKKRPIETTSEKSVSSEHSNIDSNKTSESSITDISVLRTKKPLNLTKPASEDQLSSNKTSLSNKQVDSKPPQSFNETKQAPKPSVAVKSNQKPDYYKSLDEERPTTSNLKRSFSSPNIAKLIETETSVNIPKIPSRSTKPVIRDDSSDFILNLTRSLDGVFGGSGRALCGLRNLGNSCYMNSILQCMFNTVELAEYILTNSYRRDINRSNPMGQDGRLAECFSVLLRAVWSGQYKYLVPKDFKSWIGKVNNMFADYSQEDAQELLMALLDGLHEDLNKSLKSKKPVEEENDDLVDDEAAELAWNNHKLMNDSIIVELFSGQFKATVQCISCKKLSRKFDIFMYLSLPMPQRSTSIYDLIEEFEKPEKMIGSNRWYCPRCKALRDAVKTIKIWKLPPVLIVHFKRFVYSGRWRDKIHTNINFPLIDFNLTKYVCGPHKNRLYNLYAVTHHQGAGLDSGHYVASCKSVLDNNWYKFDDTDVYKCSPPQGATSFILFYGSFKRKIPRQESISSSLGR